MCEPSQVPTPFETNKPGATLAALPDANRFELSLLFHSCASQRISPLQTVTAFAIKNNHRFCPCRHRLTRSTYRVSHPCASLVANQIKGRQDFPRYPSPTACINAAVLHVEPSLRLPTFFWWFQCCEIPKPVTYPAQHFNELPINNQRLSTALTHSTQQLRELPLHA